MIPEDEEYYYHYYNFDTESDLSLIIGSSGSIIRNNESAEPEGFAESGSIEDIDYEEECSSLYSQLKDIIASTGRSLYEYSTAQSFYWFMEESTN